MARLIPPHVLAAPPVDAAAIVPTLYDLEEFAALYRADKDRAIALVAAMAEPLLLRPDPLPTVSLESLHQIIASTLPSHACTAWSPSAAMTVLLFQQRPAHAFTNEG